MGDLPVGAIDTLRQLAEKARPLIAAVDALEGLTSIEQATRERNEAYANAKALHQDMLLQVASAGRELAGLRDEAKRLLETTERTARDMKRDAETCADKIIRDAQASAAGILQDAKEASANVDTDSAQLRSKARDDLAALKSEAREAETARDNALAELRDVQAKIDGMRETAKSIL